MRFSRRGGFFLFSYRRPDRPALALPGLLARFIVNVAALWAAQALVRGFDVDGGWALVVGALIFGAVNAVIRPVVAMFSCVLTCLTLGLFTLVVNTLMLAITAWIAGLFDLAFQVDGLIAAFLGALVISGVSTLLSHFVGSAERGSLV